MWAVNPPQEKKVDDTVDGVQCKAEEKNHNLKKKKSECKKELWKKMSEKTVNGFH